MAIRINNFGNCKSFGSFKEYLDKDYSTFVGESNHNNINKNKFEYCKKQDKISVNEGLKLIARGISKQVSEIAKTVIENPIKTAVAVGATTLGLMTLPFVGIPVAVGGAVLAVGYAGLATGKGFYHVSKFIKNNSSGNYDEARNNLEQIGRDTFDIALSAPFIPEGLKTLKKFQKYGKVKFNAYSFQKLKEAKSIKKMYYAIKDANNTVEKSINFRQVAEKELSKIRGISEAQKQKIVQYVEEYNVPREKIPEVVLEQWAKEHGISTKPKWRYEPLEKNSKGSANFSNGEIKIKDKNKPDIISTGSGQIDDSWQQVGNMQSVGGSYEITYKNKKTGQIRKDKLNKVVYARKKALAQELNDLSNECKEISTVVHERTHIDQFARAYGVEGKWKGHTACTEAEQLYREMLKEMKPMSPKEVTYYRQMANYKASGTVATYLMEPAEIQAREAQANLIKRLDFQTLDKVFKGVSNIPMPKVLQNFVLNATRTESSIAA